MKTKLILHMGMPKTGSTTLQGYLLGNFDKLVANGVLYPKVKTNKLNHNFLTLILRRKDVFSPRSFSNYEINDELNAKLFFKELQLVKNQIKKYKPHTIILSAEILFPAFNKAGGSEKVLQHLASLADSVEAVFYVRRPSDFYQAALFQKLKASHKITPPSAVSYRSAIEQTENFFGVKPVVVRFDKTTLKNGSIIDDFQSRFLSWLPRLESVHDLNCSLSAESIFIVQQYRAHNFTEQDDYHNIETVQLMSELQKNEALLGVKPKVSLKDSIREYIDYSSVDLLWLRDAYNISFAEIDYSKIKETAESLKEESLADIFNLDFELIRKLHVMTTHSFIKVTLKSRVINWVKQIIKFSKLNKFVKLRIGLLRI